MFGSILIGLIAVFFAVVLVRTLTFKPKAQPAISNEEVSFDKDGAVKALAELVKCKTISYYDHNREDDAEFEKLISKLPALYPEVFATCDFHRVDLLISGYRTDPAPEPHREQPYRPSAAF